MSIGSDEIKTRVFHAVFFVRNAFAVHEDRSALDGFRNAQIHEHEMSVHQMAKFAEHRRRRGRELSTGGGCGHRPGEQ